MKAAIVARGKALYALAILAILAGILYCLWPKRFIYGRGINGHFVRVDQETGQQWRATRGGWEPYP